MLYILNFFVRLLYLQFWRKTIQSHHSKILMIFINLKNFGQQSSILKDTYISMM